MRKMLFLLLTICFIIIYGCTTTKYTINAEKIIVNLEKDSVINKPFVHNKLSEFIDSSVNSDTEIVNNETIISSDSSFLELYFDKKTIKNLKNIRNVESYLLNPDINGTDSTSFHSFKIIQKTPELSETQLSELKHILMDKNYYQQETIVKNCTFLPDVGFRCYSNDSTFVDVLIAFYCDEWMFSSDNKIHYKDCSNARKSLIQLVKGIYKKDRYIQKLSDNN